MTDLISRKAAKVSITRYFEVHIRNQKSRRLKAHAEEICRDICFGIDAWPSVNGLTEVDLIELEDRFGKNVRMVVEDMLNGEGKRWTR